MAKQWKFGTRALTREDLANEAKVQHIVWTIAGFFVLGAVVISIRLIQHHMNTFTNPGIQSKIVGILWMVPLYATDSWLSLRFKDAALYLDMMRDCYEAYVIYLFLALMISYLGGGHHERVVNILSSLPPLPHPWPMCKWCDPIVMGPEFLRDCKMATMQFVVIKPLMAVFAVILQANGIYDQGHFSVHKGYLYTTFVMNASITYAFYYLVLFYLALGDHLKPFNPVPKFLCIKAVLFLSFWQSVVLAFLSRFSIIHELGNWSVEDVTTGIQNLLICLEMFLVSIAHNHAFPYEPFIVPDHHPMASATTSSQLRKGNIFSDQFAIGDAVRDFNEVMPVVIPTSFKPGAKVIQKSDSKQQMSIANASPLSRWDEASRISLTNSTGSSSSSLSSYFGAERMHLLSSSYDETSPNAYPKPAHGMPTTPGPGEPSPQERQRGWKL